MLWCDFCLHACSSRTCSSATLYHASQSKHCIIKDHSICPTSVSPYDNSMLICTCDLMHSTDSDGASAVTIQHGTCTTCCNTPPSHSLNFFHTHGIPALRCWLTSCVTALRQMCLWTHSTKHDCYLTARTGGQKETVQASDQQTT